MTQYYYIQTLGKAGYQTIMLKLFEQTAQLKESLQRIQTNIWFLESPQATIPGLVFSIGKETAELSKQLKEKNWYLPVYKLPSEAHHQTVARIVIRYGFDDHLLDVLASDIISQRKSRIMEN